MTPTVPFSTPEELIAQLRTLPSSPQRMQQMLALLDSPDSTVESLVEVIQLERSLAARVVHLANSPVYKGGSCGSIEEAVQRLGFAAVHEVVMTIMAIDAFPRALRSYECSANTLWRYALSTACAMRELARRTNEDVNQAYTLGLLQNVGMLAIDEWMLRKFPGVVLESAGWPVEWQFNERQWLGFDQAAPTACMLRGWKFPEQMVEAVQFQFNPEAAPGSPKLAGLLRTARWVRRNVCSVGEIPIPPDHEMLDLLEIKVDEMGAIRQKVFAEVQVLARTLKIS